MGDEMDRDTNWSFGAWVQRRRKALDLTQAALGRRVGASAAMIRKIEADERQPSRELARLLAGGLNLPQAQQATFVAVARGRNAVHALDAAPTRPPPNNLPALPNRTIPRPALQDDIVGRLRRDGVRLLTVVGPPGAGKTRLSIEAAHALLPDFADGVWWVDLAQTVDGAQVWLTIALALDLAPAPGSPVDAQVRRQLARRSLLLVLDNCEQIAAAAAQVVSALLRDCPDVRVLATSRVRLDLYSEHERPLPPMAVPPPEEQDPRALPAYEAVQLFLERARQQQPDLQLTAANAADVGRICRLVDGLPLALELAAAGLRDLSLATLAERLQEDPFATWPAHLHRTARDLPPRQRNLWSAIGHSYNLLDPQEQRVLRLLGVFSGGFDTEAAAAVCFPAAPTAGSTAQTLAELAAHHLLTQVSSAPQRWRLLEMIRVFAVATSPEAERQAAALRHAQHYAARSGDWLSHWYSPETLAAVQRDLDNYRAALQTALMSGEAALANRLGVALGDYCEVRGLLVEGQELLDRVLRMPGDVPPALRFPVLHRAATMAWMQHDFGSAAQFTARALALTRRHNLPREEAVALSMLGRIRLEQSRYAEADEALVAAIALSESLRPPRDFSLEQIQRGEVALALGDVPRAAQLTGAGLEGTRPEALIPYCVGWNNLAEIALSAGDAARARDALAHVSPLAHIHARRARFFLLTTAGLLLLDPPAGAAAEPAAARLLATVSAANERLGDPLPPWGQARLLERLQLVQQRLSPAQWQTAAQVGQDWELAQGLAEAQQAVAARPQ